MRAKMTPLELNAGVTNGKKIKSKEQMHYYDGLGASSS